MMINKALFISNNECWATPVNLFNTLNKEFNFTLDPAANSYNYKCENYFTELENGLLMPWYGNVYLNPPYGRELPKWIDKAINEIKNCEQIVILVPSRTDTKWFHKAYINSYEVRFIKGRLKFDDIKESAPFPSCLFIMSKFKPLNPNIIYIDTEGNVI